MQVLRRTLGLGVGALLLAAPGLGQTVEAELSLDRREPRPIEFQYVAADGGLVTVANTERNSSRDLSVYKYDGAFNRQWQLPLYQANDRRQLEGLFVVGQEILVFYADYLAKENQVVEKVARYTLDGRALTTDEVVAVSNYETQLRGLFTFERSVDKARLVGIGQLNPPRSDRAYDRRPVTLTYLALQRGQSRIDTGSVTLPYVNEEFEWQQTSVGNSGTVWVVGRITPLGEGDRERQVYDYALVRIEPSRRSVQEIRLELQDKYITDMLLKVDRNDDVVAVGFYSEQRNGSFIGVFYARVAKDATTLTVTGYNRFANEFLANFLTARQIDRGRELTTLFLDKIVLRTDGGALVLAEEFYKTSQADRVGVGVGYGGFVNYTTFYHYDNVAAISVGPDGKVEWTSILRKNQVSDSPLELSYFPLVVSDQVLFFYRASERVGGSNVYLAGMDYEGRVGAPKPYFQNFANNDIFYRGSAEQISNSSAILVFYIARERAFRIAKIRY